MNTVWRTLAAIVMCALVIASLLVAILAVMDAIDHSPVHLLRVLICVPLLIAARALYRWADRE